jgi:gamma-glutamylcysteine synthetase
VIDKRDVAQEDKVLEKAVAELAAAYEARFPEQIVRPRIVGREAEFPVVDASGHAADVRRMWDALIRQGDYVEKYDPGNPNLLVALQGEDYSYALEVGLGTVEVNTRPCDDLFCVERIMQEAVGLLVRAASTFGWRLLAYGIQPISEPSLPLMSPKQRYQSLYRAMGREWLWYTVTASDQVQIDITRQEAVAMLNFGNLMAPVIIALCANSPVYGGELSAFCSGREGEMALIHANEHRHGMPETPFSSIADYVMRSANIQHLILRTDGEVVPSSRPFVDCLLETGPDLEQFLFHEHYIWNSARLRVAYGTLEMRPACQQPWADHMAAAALGLGLVEAAEPIMDYVQETLGDSYWEILRTYHRQAIARGLLAPEPAPGFLQSIVERAESGLRDRGSGEESMLQPLWQRLHRRVNPAQRLRRVYTTDGLQGIIARTTIRPATIPASI